MEIGRELREASDFSSVGKGIVSENNSTPSGTRRRFSNLSKVESEYWGTLTHIRQKYSFVKLDMFPVQIDDIWRNLLEG